MFQKSEGLVVGGCSLLPPGRPQAVVEGEAKVYRSGEAGWGCGGRRWQVSEGRDGGHNVAW